MLVQGPGGGKGLAIKVSGERVSRQRGSRFSLFRISRRLLCLEQNLGRSIVGDEVRAVARVLIM